MFWWTLRRLRSENAKTRQEAASKLATPKAFDSLIRELTKKESRVYGGILAEILGKIGDVRAVEPLVICLKRGGYGERAAAVEALAKLGQSGFDALVSILRGKEASFVRCDAAKGLATVGSLAVETLVACLKDGDKEVRKSVSQALKKIGYNPPDLDAKIACEIADQDSAALAGVGQSAVRPLITLFKDKDSEVRNFATRTLTKIGLPAMEQLTLCLKDQDGCVSRCAAEVLQNIGYKPADLESKIVLLIAEGDFKSLVPIGAPAVGALVACLNKGNFDSKYAAEALGKIGGLRALEALVACSKNPNSHARKSAVCALAHFSDRRSMEALVECLREKDRDIIWLAESSLTRIGPPAIELVVACLKARNAHTRHSAAEVLQKIGYEPSDLESRIAYQIARRDWSALVTVGQSAVEPLLTCLNDEDADVRRSVTSALSKIKIERVQRIEPLLSALRDSNRDVRSGAAELVGRFDDPRVVDSLIAALEDREPSVRAAAASALSRFKDPQIVGPLLSALRDRESGVRSSAERALSRIKDASAVDPVIAMLRDSNKDLRLAAVNILGELKDRRAVEPLIVALKDSDFLVATWAVRALISIQDSRAIEPLNEVLKSCPHATARSEAARAAVYLKAPHAVEVLIGALKDDYDSVREVAANGLGELGDARAVDALIAALTDVVIKVRIVAAAALGTLGHQRAVAPLIGLLKQPETALRRSAVVALREIKDPRAVESLCVALQDTDAGMRNEVVTALGRFGDSRAIGPLLKCYLNEHEWNKVCAAGAINSIGTMATDKLSNDALRELCRLEDVKIRVSGCMDSTIHDVSFHQLRQLSRQELVRRGAQE